MLQLSKPCFIAVRVYLPKSAPRLRKTPRLHAKGCLSFPLTLHALFFGLRCSHAPEALTRPTRPPGPGAAPSLGLSVRLLHPQLCCLHLPLPSLTDTQLLTTPRHTSSSSVGFLRGVLQGASSWVTGVCIFTSGVCTRVPRWAALSPRSTAGWPPAPASAGPRAGAQGRMSWVPAGASVSLTLPAPRASPSGNCLCARSPQCGSLCFLRAK